MRLTLSSGLNTRQKRAHQHAWQLRGQLPAIQFKRLRHTSMDFVIAVFTVYLTRVYVLWGAISKELVLCHASESRNETLVTNMVFSFISYQVWYLEIAARKFTQNSVWNLEQKEKLLCLAWCEGGRADQLTDQIFSILAQTPCNVVLTRLLTQVP